MISHFFSVYDSKVEVFMAPWNAVNKGQAIRTFSDLVNDSNHPWSKHIEDYSLFELGTFDDSCAKFELLKAPERVALAIELKHES